jgi:THO complex subunit 2
VRFDIYGIWLGTGIGKLGLNDINKSIDCCHAEMVASQHIRALLKRITADNAKVIGKKLARYFPTCPLVVYDYLIKHVCAYENLIPIIIDSMKYASELGFDCMAYCLVRKLRQSVAAGSSAEPKMKEEDTNVTQWFANICKFTATFYMKYPTTELKALFDYILQQCSHGNAVDLLLLKDLLNVMGGCDSIVEVSPQQLEGLSGGRTLRNEMMKGSSGDGASLTKSRALLREA